MYLTGRYKNGESLPLTKLRHVRGDHLTAGYSIYISLSGNTNLGMRSLTSKISSPQTTNRTLLSNGKEKFISV